MRADDADQFAGGDDFGFLPELWEMALIAGDQMILVFFQNFGKWR